MINFNFDKFFVVMDICANNLFQARVSSTGYNEKCDKRFLQL